MLESHPPERQARSDAPTASAEVMAIIDIACDHFERMWQARESPQMEAFLEQAPSGHRQLLFQELLAIDIDYRRQHGESPSAGDYLRRFPHFAETVVDLCTASSACGSLFPGATKVPASESVAFDIPVSKACTSESGGPVRRLGHFELLYKLGVGGFGTVWKARDTQLDRYVAVKVPRDIRLDPIQREQFLREARAAAQLQHPHIVRIHEVGQADDSIYIVSEFIEGGTLGEALAARPLTVRRTCEICATIARALHHAHSQGVIHRDLKPSNVMLDRQGEPHLMDFGLARRESGEMTLTYDGQILGTPAYMSPEQARGEGHRTDGRTDVYALGAVMFQMLTQELPFRGDTRAILRQVLEDEPPSPRAIQATVPRDVETICLHSLAKLPAHRYADALQLAEDLERFLQGEPIAARPLGPIARWTRWCQRKPTTAIAWALTTFLALAGPPAAWRLYRHNDELSQAHQKYSHTIKEMDVKDKQLQQLQAVPAPSRLPKPSMLALLTDLAWEHYYPIFQQQASQLSTKEKTFAHASMALLAHASIAPSLSAPYLQQAISVLESAATSDSNNDHHLAAIIELTLLQEQLAHHMHNPTLQASSHQLAIKSVESLSFDDSTDDPWVSLRDRVRLLTLQAARVTDPQALRQLTGLIEAPGAEEVPSKRVRGIATDELLSLVRATRASPPAGPGATEAGENYGAYEALIRAARDAVQPRLAIISALENELVWPTHWRDTYYVICLLTDVTPWLLDAESL